MAAAAVEAFVRKATVSALEIVEIPAEIATAFQKG